MIPSKSSNRVVIDNSHIDIDNNSDDSEVEINYQSKKSSSFHVKSPVKTHQSLKSSPQIRNRSSSSSASTSSSDEERPNPGIRPFYLLKCVFCSTLRFLQFVSIKSRHSNFEYWKRPKTGALLVPFLNAPLLFNS